MKRKIFNIIAILLIISGVLIIGYEVYSNLKDSSEDKQIVDSFILDYGEENEELEDKQKIEKTTVQKTSNNTSNVNQNISKPFVIDWKRLKETNPDVVAWIRIPHTNINYPVLKGETNNSYIRHNLYKEYSRSGSIFISENNDNPFIDFNTIIYGHNLGNGRMFSQLKKYKDQNFYEQHKYIYIYYPDETIQKYKIVSFHSVNDGNAKIYNLNVDNYKDYKEYVNKNNKIKSTFSFKDEDVKKIITLSTCTNVSKDGRYVLHAVLT